MTNEEKIKYLTRDLIDQWFYSHCERCRNDWPHEGPCHWPLPYSLKDMSDKEILDILKGVKS